MKTSGPFPGTTLCKFWDGCDYSKDVQDFAGHGDIAKLRWGAKGEIVVYAFAAIYVQGNIWMKVV